MEIISNTCEDRHTLQLRGRLDANWAEHVGHAIESAIRAGQHYIEIDMALVEYISSMGMGVLMKYYKQLKSISGLLRVVNPHENILDALRIVNLAKLLVESEEVPRPAMSHTKARCWQRNRISFESHKQPNDCALAGHLHGYPEKFATGQLSAAQSCRINFCSDVFGLGLGAFGKDSEDSSQRIGEFLAAAGAAITQPTDGSSVPDFQVSEGQFVPEMYVLYGMTATGRFSQLLRFEPAAGERRAIALGELVEVVLEDSCSSAAGFVIMAETSSLVGATLRQSPVTANGHSPWGFPAVRDWLSFTTEPTDERYVALIVGIAQRVPPVETAAFFHRIGQDTTARGHFHAAIFPYRPVPKGNINLQDSIRGLLGTESARTVMHLLADDREFEGVGETELIRGACWCGPLQMIQQRM